MYPKIVTGKVQAAYFENVFSDWSIFREAVLLSNQRFPFKRDSASCRGSSQQTMAAADASQSDVEQKKRFATVEDDDLKQLLTEKDVKSTRRATDSAVRTFKTYLHEKSLNEDFEEMTPSELDSTLSKLYAEARTEDGELYKKSSLRSIRYGINRYLANLRSGKDIVHDKDFNEANQVFIAASKDLKRQGKGGITHYPPLELKDLHKLYEYLDSNNNVKLQEKVFADLMLYFGRRGRENIHDLKITDFAATTDVDGRVYVYIKWDELTKNHQEDENTADGRM